MASRWYSVVVDCGDVQAQARFWSQVLAWPVVYQSEDEVVLAADSEPGLVFVPAPEGKTVKNRLHIDLAPDDQEREVERVLALGATRADIGQGEQPWVVLADPEGNEFCVLTAR